MKIQKPNLLRVNFIDFMSFSKKCKVFEKVWITEENQTFGFLAAHFRRARARPHGTQRDGPLHKHAHPLDLPWAQVPVRDRAIRPPDIGDVS